MAEKNDSIGIRELIAKIEKDLRTPHEESLFVVGHVDLQISFTVERDATGGINIQVVSLGADKKSTEVQTVTVSLEPILPVEEVRKQLTKGKSLSEVSHIAHDLAARQKD